MSIAKNSHLPTNTAKDHAKQLGATAITQIQAVFCKKHKKSSAQSKKKQKKKTAKSSKFGHDYHKIKKKNNKKNVKSCMDWLEAKMQLFFLPQCVNHHRTFIRVCFWLVDCFSVCAPVSVMHRIEGCQHFVIEHMYGQWTWENDQWIHKSIWRVSYLHFIHRLRDFSPEVIDDGVELLECKLL